MHHIVAAAGRDRRILGLSALVSLIILLLTYILGNTPYAMPGDHAALDDINDFKTFIGSRTDNMPDSLLLVNVCYDKQMVSYEENGMPVGEIVITNREKLLKLLTIAREADNYRYLFLDILFDKGIKTPVDSALFHTIASMDRIIIPSHKGIELQDSILYAKAANADYSVNWKVLIFSRYQFLRDDSVQTVPLKMYADNMHIDGHGIEPHWGGLWYTDAGKLCQNGITLYQRVVIRDRLQEQEGQAREFSYSYLGADLLDQDSLLPVKEQIQDKIVVIGDFKEDRHVTYLGSQPGTVVCLNDYLALMAGDHLVNWWFVCVLFLIYMIVGTFYLKGNSFSSLFRRPWLCVLMSFLSTATLFFIISLVASWYEMAFNIWVPTTVYSLIDTYVQKRNLYKEKKNEKAISTTVAKPAG